MTPRAAIGVDVGGSGVKAAVVAARTGRLLSERICLPTPQPAVPGAVADVLRALVDAVEHNAVEHNVDISGPLPVGVAFPAPIVQGAPTSVTNLDGPWPGCDLRSMFGDAVGRPVQPLNDADAAGYGEMLFGAARGEQGTVLVLTLGTGIGSAVIHNGHLVPNTELGHLEVGGLNVEAHAAAAVRTREGLSWRMWATDRLQPYLDTLQLLFSPDVVVVGGGVSVHHQEFLPLLDFHGARGVPAVLRNDAGIVGAATWATARPGAPGRSTDVLGVPVEYSTDESARRPRGVPAHLEERPGSTEQGGG